MGLRGVTELEADAEALQEMYGQPVSVYGDDQAVEDGLLVDVKALMPFPVSRVSRAVWEAFTFEISPRNFGHDDAAIDVSRLMTLGERIRQKIEDNEWRDDWIILEFDGQTIWCVPNGVLYGGGEQAVEGLTVMMPQDY